MKQIHVWPNHVRIEHLDLVLYRPPTDSLESCLSALARLGLDTRPGNVVVHEARPTG